MKKIIIVIFSLVFLSSNAIANAETLAKFDEWLNINGYHEYLDKESNNVRYFLDRSVCKDEIITQEYTTLKKCVGADGTIIPNSDLKFKKIYPNNLDIKINNKKLSGTNLAYHSNPNRDSLIYYLWKYSYRDRGSILKEFKSTNNSYDF